MAWSLYIFRPGGGACGTAGYKLISLSLQRMLVSLSPLCRSQIAIAHLPYILHMHISSVSCAGHIHAQAVQGLLKQGCSTSLTSCRMSAVRSSSALIGQLCGDDMPCCNRRPVLFPSGLL